jgi:hypothetical protein
MNVCTVGPISLHTFLAHKSSYGTLEFFSSKSHPWAARHKTQRAVGPRTVHYHSARLCTVCGSKCLHLIARVPATGSAQSMQATGHRLIQTANLGPCDLAKCNLQGIPKVFSARKHASRQRLQHEGPNMFNGVHVRRIWGPLTPIEHINSLGIQEVRCTSGLVNRRPVLLKSIRTCSVKFIYLCIIIHGR